MKVLLIVIDAATPRVVCPAVQTGHLANFARLADAGEMHQSSVTIFPSITPAATSSIITGTYPMDHGISGASWLNRTTGEIAYYGDDFWVIAKEGFGTYVRDFLIHLNGDRLTAPTLFEIVERSGQRAACLNYLIYRGLVRHKVNIPWLMAMLPGVPFAETVDGPSMLWLGDFVSSRTEDRHRLRHRGGVLERFGMDDASTATMLCDMAEKGSFPDFTVAYFADNDYRSHEVGPHGSLPVVAAVDAALGRMFDAAGGFERFIAETCIVVTSDHGHCEVRGDEGARIRLDEVLADFVQADLGRGWQDGDELLICPNMRAAQIYLRNPNENTFTRMTRSVLADPRIDLMMWRDRRAEPGPPSYTVVSPRGTLKFWRNAPGGSSGTDAYGTEWRCEGEPAALQLVRDQARLESTEYPNAFERIAGVLDGDDSGDIWVTAKPGCEFQARGGKAHVGGASHGALHVLDSLSPVIVAGAPFRLPMAMRSIDLAPLCMKALGIDMRYAAGGPRVCTRPAARTPGTG